MSLLRPARTAIRAGLLASSLRARSAVDKREGLYLADRPPQRPRHRVEPVTLREVSRRGQDAVQLHDRVLDDDAATALRGDRRDALIALAERAPTIEFLYGEKVRGAAVALDRRRGAAALLYEGAEPFVAASKVVGGTAG